MRAVLTVSVALVALLAAAATAQAELRFTPCTEKGQEGFECATLRVPLDRSGKVPGTLRLRVQRLIQEHQPEAVLINVEGGPGGSATWRSQQSARLFAPLRDRYQLVLVDPRGIGATAVNTSRPSGLMPSGGTGESVTTRSVWSGCVRAYWLTTNVPYDVP